MGRLKTFNRLSKLCFGKSLTLGLRLWLMADVLWERIRYGTEIQDYFQYGFYKLKNRERRKYMTFTKLRYTISVCNDPSKRSIFDDKALFNKTFAKYINRDWLDVTECTFDEFSEFVKKHPSFFAKARSGMFGKNAEKYDTDPAMTPEKTKQLFEKLRRNGCIIEQLITQHPTLSTFNSTSVNTLRIVTLRCADGTPRIMAGVLRIGRRGKSADNFHHYGIAATIDVATGIINAPGIDRNFKRYIIHPDSGEQIIGYNVPSWDKVTDIVTKAAMTVPQVRYVGWDVAIDDNGNTQLIEGNYGADPDVTQMPCRTGKWPLFAPEVEKIARKNNA
ncbi:sugar-transfer associated ATP-grasp domain-containing protein [Ruminococcus sp. NK3A76]|uniref:sugar-transfer associated ATP-grasp domain-containing protein n=1 Tax=Ruminococcus sp. NK3A76 TaxID=877411 RepID=UPI000691BF09|nr:sugar-transfer associated ATP-grasp domain-containing protein [Ruminococcus sp. NK3A76]